MKCRRLGILNESISLLGTDNDVYDMTVTNHRIGQVNYELNNHLGNVLSVVSDKPIPHDNSGTADYWLADIRQATDYSPFGVTLSGRNFTLTGATKSRHGYQGSEMDNEMKGEGNSYTTFNRMLDPRLGRWFSMDPVIQSWQSPYCSMDNNPIWHNDPMGDYVRYGAKGKEKRELKRLIREQRKLDPTFDSAYKSWISDNNCHTLFPISYTDPKDPSETNGAQQDPLIPYLFTNSNHQKADKRRGNCQTSKKGETINCYVTNSHHYIGKPEPRYDTQDFELLFATGTNELLTDLGPVNDFVNNNNVVSVKIDIGYSGKKEKGSALIDGRREDNISGMDLAKSRGRNARNNLNYNNPNMQYSDSTSLGKTDGESVTGTSMQSKVSVKTVRFEFTIR